MAIETAEGSIGEPMTTRGLSDTVPLAFVLECPHHIMSAEHYQEDGSCRCDDPGHLEMRSWGFVWRGDRWS